MFGQFVCHLGSAAKPATSRAEGSAQVSEPPPRKGPAMSGEVKTGTGENDDWDVGDGKNHTGRVFPPQHAPRTSAAVQPRSRAAAQRFPLLSSPTGRCSQNPMVHLTIWCCTPYHTMLRPHTRARERVCVPTHAVLPAGSMCVPWSQTCSSGVAPLVRGLRPPHLLRSRVALVTHLKSPLVPTCPPLVRPPAPLLAAPLLPAPLTLRPPTRQPTRSPSFLLLLICSARSCRAARARRAVARGARPA